MPVGNSDHAVACRLNADIVLVAHVAAHKAEHPLAIRIGNEQFGKLRHIRSVKIAAARHAAICTAHQLAAERVEQTVVHNQSRRDDQELPRESRVVNAFGERGRLVE